MLNMDGIGTLNRKVDILDYIERENELGAISQSLEPVFSRVWARIEPTRGREYIEEYKQGVEQTFKITIRYRHGIRADQVVQYKDRRYRIKTVVNPYESNVKLELMCTRDELGGDSGVDDI